MEHALGAIAPASGFFCHLAPVRRSRAQLEYCRFIGQQAGETWVVHVRSCCMEQTHVLKMLGVLLPSRSPSSTDNSPRPNGSLATLRDGVCVLDLRKSAQRNDGCQEGAPR
jgi:hypothetical protein